MKRMTTFVTVVGLVVCLSGQLWAGGGRATFRSGPNRVVSSGLAVQPAPVLRGAGRHGAVFYGYPYYPYYYQYPYGYYGYYYRPVTVISPYSYYYPYYTPATVVLSSPFYCFVHNVGFVTRVGFLDHVSGTHKIPLETVASICPDGYDGCIADGY